MSFQEWKSEGAIGGMFAGCCNVPPKPLESLLSLQGSTCVVALTRITITPSLIFPGLVNERFPLDGVALCMQKTHHQYISPNLQPRCRFCVGHMRMRKPALRLNLFQTSICTTPTNYVLDSPREHSPHG